MTPIPPHPNTVCDPTLIWLWGWGWPGRGHCAQVTEQNTGTLPSSSLHGLPASLFPPWRQRGSGSPTMTFQPTPGSRLGLLRPPSVPSRVPQPLGLASPLPKTSLLINQPPGGRAWQIPRKRLKTQPPPPTNPLVPSIGGHSYPQPGRQAPSVFRQTPA